MASQEQYRQKQENISSILGVLRAQDLTRREVCEKLGLSWACVSDLVNELVGQKILTEEKIEASTVKGRKPVKLSLSRDKRFLGVDINRMGLHLCLCDLYGEKVVQSAFVLECDTQEQLLHCVCSHVREMLTPEVLGIGLAMQGPRLANGLWAFPGPCGELRVDVATAVREQSGLPVWIEHDPNCILLGFVDRPQGRMMTVRVDKGVGVSLCRNGQFSDDPLEVGRMPLDGRRLHEWMGTPQAGDYLGQALGILCNLIDVDQVVLCGQRIAQDAAMFARLENSYRATATAPVALRTEAVTDAALGAARLATMRYPQGV